MSEYTIRHLLEDGTSEDYKVDIGWEMVEVQSVYPTKVRFDDIPMVVLEDVFTRPIECIGVYDLISDIKQDYINNPFSSDMDSSQKLTTYKDGKFVDRELTEYGKYVLASVDTGIDPKYDGVWNFDKLLWWIWEKEQSMKVKRGKMSFYIQPEKVISGVVPDGDLWVAYDEWSDHYLGQLEIVEDDGKVHRGLCGLGYKADDYLKPSASVIDEKLKPYGEWQQSNNYGGMV